MFQPAGNPQLPTQYHVYESNVMGDNIEYHSHILQMRNGNSDDHHLIFRGNVGYNHGSYAMQCGGYSKIVNRDKILAADDSIDEAIIYAEINLKKDENKTPDLNIFNNWTDYKINMIFPKFIIERVLKFFGMISYKFMKRKFY